MERIIVRRPYAGGVQRTIILLVISEIIYREFLHDMPCEIEAVRDR
jgi:hypothetical protein